MPMFELYKVIETRKSPANGTIKVVKTLEGVRIVVGGLSQSGWLVKKVWNAALKKVKNTHPNASNVLILGLGGGSVCELLDNYWPSIKKTGIDIDSSMVELGYKYLNLKKVKNLKFIEADAKDWVAKNQNKKYELILVDLYKGSNFPKVFKQEKFIKSLKNICKKDGVIIFNHLYSSAEKHDADEFRVILHKLFSSLILVQPEANILFVCFQ